MRYWLRAKQTKKHYYNMNCVASRKVIIRCDYCGKKKEIYLSEFKDAKRHFCNVKCRKLWMLGKQRGRPAKTTACGESGDKIGFVFDGKSLEMTGNTNGIKYKDFV